MEHKEEESVEDEALVIIIWEAIGWLGVLTLWISVLSGYLVNAIEVACGIVDIVKGDADNQSNVLQNWKRNILGKVYKQLKALWSLKATTSWEGISD
ncbi:hypothetical protein C5167_017364 [Papaver somniferum]|uniref:Uncharacterized protein n=1 Tax=Papaver somniferum TaxID=3469 RepID=A0A4Y7IN87_PAPSO|nr:hypothetical protein C5167_017364 [Papaver somniferum]